MPPNLEAVHKLCKVRRGREVSKSLLGGGGGAGGWELIIKLHNTSYLKQFSYKMTIIIYKINKQAKFSASQDLIG